MQLVFLAKLYDIMKLVTFTQVIYVLAAVMLMHDVSPHVVYINMCMVCLVNIMILRYFQFYIDGAVDAIVFK